MTNITQQTAERIMRLAPDFNLNMRHFTSQPKFEKEEKEQHICQTSYCIAGRLASLDKYPDQYFRGPYTQYFDFTNYSADLVPNEATWQFLFSEEWPDDLTQAKLRAAYVMQHDSAPGSFIEEWAVGDIYEYTMEESSHMWDDWYPQMKKYMADNPSEFE